MGNNPTLMTTTYHLAWARTTQETWQNPKPTVEMQKISAWNRNDFCFQYEKTFNSTIIGVFLSDEKTSILSVLIVE